MKVTLRETGEVVKTRTLEDHGTRGTWNEILDIPYSDKQSEGKDNERRKQAVTPVRGALVGLRLCLACVPVAGGGAGAVVGLSSPTCVSGWLLPPDVKHN